MIRFDEVFLRHPGVYDVVHDTEKAGKKDGAIERVQVAVHHKLSAGEVVGLIREGIAKDASATFYIHAATRGDTGHIGWIDRSNIDHLFGEVEDNGRMELPDERPAPALVFKRKKPVRPVDDPVDAGVPAAAVPSGGPVRDLPAEKKPRKRREPTKLPGDRFPVVRGKALQLGKLEGWPKSPPAQVVRSLFEGTRKDLTAAEIVVMVGKQVQELGCAFPASLVSRLKQGGFLKEVTE